MTLSYPLVLQCGEEFIAVPISTITKYSSVFKALFLGEEYRNSDASSDSKLKENVDQEDGNNNSDIDLKQATKEPLCRQCKAQVELDINQTRNKIRNLNQADIFVVTCAGGNAVKGIFNYLDGYNDMLLYCNDFSSIKDILTFCDTYAMKVPELDEEIYDMIPDIELTLDNVLDAVECSQMMPNGSSQREELLSRCYGAAESRLNTYNTLLNFIVENKTKSSAVVVLLESKYSRKKASYRRTFLNFSDLSELDYGATMLSDDIVLLNRCWQIRIEKCNPYSPCISITAWFDGGNSGLYNSKFVFKIINQKGGEDLIESKSLTFENRFMKSTFDIDELEKPDSPFVLDDAVIFCIEFDFNSFDPRDIALEVSEHELHTMYNLNPTENRFEAVSEKQCYPPDIQKVNYDYGAPVLLQCGDILLPVNENILIQESPVFKAMLSKSWHRDEGKVKSELPVVPLQNQGSLETIQINKIYITEFDPLAVKSLFHYIMGYMSNLMICNRISVLGEMLRVCDFYAITSPVGDIKNRIDAIHITVRNVTEVYEISESLGLMQQYEHFSSKLKYKCIHFLRCNLITRKQLLSFVMENVANISTAMKLVDHLKNDDHIKLRFYFNPESSYYKYYSQKRSVKGLIWSVSVKKDDTEKYLNFILSSSLDEDSSMTASVTLGLYNFTSHDFEWKDCGIITLNKESPSLKVEAWKIEDMNPFKKKDGEIMLEVFIKVESYEVFSDSETEPE